MKQFLIVLTTIFIWTCSSSPTKSEPAPQPPTVNNLSITTNEDTPTTFTMTGTDPEGAALTFSVSTQPQNGTVTASGAAGTYTPNENFNGTDTFAYIASDGALSSTAGVVNVTVTAVDDEPNTMNVSAITDEDNAVVITLEAEEYDGDTISFNIKDNPTSGSVTISGDKATYTPNENYYGSDSFTFEAEDYTAKKILNTATASITINPINDAPVVEDISVEEWNNKDISITLTGTDVEGDNLTFQIVDNPTNVNATIDGTTLTINKSSSFWGADSLTYYAYDGADYGESATVDINFKRYVNYNRSSYELKHNEYWYEQYYFRDTFGDEALGQDLGVSEADFNGDGYVDVLIGKTSEVNIRKELDLFINNGDNTFYKANELIDNNTGTIFMRKELIGDFNGDNYPDVFFIGHGTHADGKEHQSSLMSNGDGTYENIIYDDIHYHGFTHGGASADVDLDGDLDIFLCASQDNIEGVLLENDGNGNFTENYSIIDSQDRTFWEAEFYDLNGDNYPDLIIDGNLWGVQSPNDNINRIFWNNGGSFDTSNSFSLPPAQNSNYSSTPQIIDHCFGDLDGDGNIEIIGTVTFDYTDSQIVIYSHDGDYNYQDKTLDFIENHYVDTPGEDDVTFRIRLQDIDNNGSIDLFRDIKDASNGPYALRWEWNGSKFIPQF